jgi:anaerobic dimethyl sulfoxide reductase subunit B (iron-sulfur subunit)
MTYAFTFDACACTGCKACQIACKDKNNLPVGVLWRRVYEISGGTWQKQNDAWETNVFAYNLSIACNHCVHPKCAGVCPTDAYVQREDGIVYIEESKCMGCGYCAWACPYSAPCYNPELRHMTKCNFCYDNLDTGLPPACVAACPMRVLNLIKIEEKDAGNEAQLPDSSKRLWLLPGSQHPFPLPVRSRTEPHLTIQPHTGMGNELEKGITNWEEIKTGKTKSELPLVAFTLLIQMAAGMAVVSLFSGPLSLLLLFVLGGLIGTGGVVAFLHLGTPTNAWRAVFHLKKSWLSREILMFGLFGMSWSLTLFLPGMGKLPLALCGIGLIYSMAQVYRLRSIQAWDSNLTLWAFALSSMVLGGAGMFLLSLFGDSVYVSGYLFVSGAGLVGALLASLSERNPPHQMASRLRSGLIVLAFVGIAVFVIVTSLAGKLAAVSIFILALSEECIGRWLFYEHLHRRVL